MSQIDDVSYDRETVRGAIAAASQVFQGVQGGSVRTKPDGSFVTDTDLLVQRAVVGVIERRHRNDLIVAEEERTDAQPPALPSGNGGRWWGVDPIDGTTNFVSRIPVYCVSVGLCKGRTPKVGAIWDPSRSQLHGSWDVRRDPWPTIATIGELRVGVEFEGPGDVPAQAASVIHRLVPTAAMVRVFGCAALGLAWVSMGWLDAFFHPRLAPWDYAAGSALVAAAGGLISSPHVGIHSSWVLAASPSAFPIMTGYVRETVGS